MKKLFLDDNRQPWDETWDLVKTPAAFRTYIKELFVKTKQLPDVISFDHDLHVEHYSNEMYKSDVKYYNNLYKSFKHETGLGCAKWLVNFCVDNGLKIPEINIHSANPIGADNIAQVIMNTLLFYYEEERIITPKPYNQKPEL